VVNTGWVLTQSFQGTNTIAEYFGNSVAINAAGDRLVVGAYLNSTGIASAGKVYAYNYVSDTGWVLTQSFQGTNTISERFGYALAINSAGDRLVVGAYTNSTGVASAGKVYAYNYVVNTGWVLTQSFQGTNTIAENFGNSVAINAAGDRLVVGANLNSGGVSNAGKVYAYNYVNGSGWVLISGANGSFQGTNLLAENFGYALALNDAGDRLVVGAYINPTGIESAGKVYTYQELFNPRLCNALASNTSLIVAGGGPTTTNMLAWSADSGSNWQNSYNGTTTFPFSGGVCQALGWNGSKWVAGGIGTNPLAYSYDGKTWIQSANGTGIFNGTPVQCSGITWNGVYWLAVGNGSTTLAYSSNGITWLSTPYILNSALAIASRRVTSNALRSSASTLATTSYNQEWINVTALRATIVTYYNTTGRPIMVSITGPLTTGANFSQMFIYVNGQIAASGYYGGCTTSPFINAIVPVNAAYYFTNTGTTNTFLYWLELR
jgi:hypothetical protein